MLTTEPKVEHTERSEFSVMTGTLRNLANEELNGVIRLEPTKRSGRTVLWLDARGKVAIFADGGKPNAEVARLLDAGCLVLGIDLFQQDEPTNRTVANPREAPAYTYGYNRALFAQRVHDVLGALHFARASEPKNTLTIFATGGTGPLTAAALAVEPTAADAAVIDTGGFRFENVADWRDANFLPAAAKYGDLPGLLTLVTPRPVFVIGEGERAPVSAALDWLLKQGAKQP